MSLNLDKIKSRLNSLTNTNTKSNLIWKPTPGKQVIRIIPYKFNTDNPFIELKFHYGLNGKTYLSPDTFNRPDPIVEFSNKLKKTGDKEEWKFGKKLEPKLRTFAPVLVRGQENEGVKFWGFGKNVFQEILSVISDPDYGDITEFTSGRDVVVEFRTAEECGKQYPETSIRVKPNSTPAVDPSNKELIAKIQNQTNILDLFPELTYEELKNIMNAWLESGMDADSSKKSAEANPETEPKTEPKSKNESVGAPFKTTEPVGENRSPSNTASKATKSSNADVEETFANLFNT